MTRPMRASAAKPARPPNEDVRAIVIALAKLAAAEDHARDSQRNADHGRETA